MLLRLQRSSLRQASELHKGASSVASLVVCCGGVLVIYGLDQYQINDFDQLSISSVNSANDT
jgi:hypothetical protein